MKVPSTRFPPVLLPRCSQLYVSSLAVWFIFALWGKCIKWFLSASFFLSGVTGKWMLRFGSTPLCAAPCQLVCPVTMAWMEGRSSVLLFVVDGNGSSADVMKVKRGEGGKGVLLHVQ